VRGWPSGRASAFQADLHGFDSRTPLQTIVWFRLGWTCPTTLTGLVYCGTSIMQSVLSGKLHGGKTVIAVVNRLGSFRVFDQSVIAPPASVLELMEFHFDLNALVNALNHKCPPSSSLDPQS
jgi:hypothetical protein